MRLTQLLAERGDDVIGLIRNSDQASEVSAQGATPVVCDLEQATVEELAEHITDAAAAVFAAGAGAGSGAERKLTVDRDGAVKLLQAATAIGAPRFVIVSSVGAEDPPGDDDVFSVYLRAKAAADEAVQASDREWTIVRPGPLTDDPGTGLVQIDPTPFRGQVPRDDVAAVIARLLPEPRASRRVLYVSGGAQPLEAELEAVLSQPAR